MKLVSSIFLACASLGVILVILISMALGVILTFVNGYVLQRYYECFITPWFKNAPELPYAAFVCVLVVIGVIKAMINSNVKTETTEKTTTVSASITPLASMIIIPIFALLSGWIMSHMINYFCETSLSF